MDYFNLLVPYNNDRLDFFRTFEYRYLVAQTFIRGHSASYPEKRPILLTPYPDIEQACEHLAHVYVDKYKAIIDLGNPKHCSKLQEMSVPASIYLLYVGAVKDATAIEIANYEGLAEAVHKFIAVRQKPWMNRLEAVAASMELRFGEFYLTISLDGEYVTERLCVVEHFNLKESANTFPTQLILGR